MDETIVIEKCCRQCFRQMQSYVWRTTDKVITHERWITSFSIHGSSSDVANDERNCGWWMRPCCRGWCWRWPTKSHPTDMWWSKMALVKIKELIWYDQIALLITPPSPQMNLFWESSEVEAQSMFILLFIDYVLESLLCVFLISTVAIITLNESALTIWESIFWLECVCYDYRSWKGVSFIKHMLPNENIYIFFLLRKNYRSFLASSYLDWVFLSNSLVWS